MNYRCPLCQTMGVVPDEARGHEVLCLKCRRSFFIPDKSVEERMLLGVLFAARRNDGEVIREFALQQADLDVQESKYGHTPLHLASLHGKLHALQELLEGGAKLEMRATRTMQTPLLYAVREGHAEATTMLINKGANLDARDPDGCGALHWAARKGFLDVAQVLVKAGADLEMNNVNGLRPLQFAVAYHQPAVRDFLVAAERAAGFLQRQLAKGNKNETMNRVLFGVGSKKKNG
ncbi:ankyrin repeat domain-containing protein [Blastopirellula sp. JC732]|uniref:Ankyrin repeat domain-containing protein n=1 Tax=Blastopirellula sediminis TaxID=2894196 RepID=A0A9X1MKG3_9BACT|nr:ankyrin repeat domain-containing protein [Blastopirellula sediminis]MCC9608762.1 ankyrin repeat domain-containing protein [Blastopirellula sediminis]MCC9628461.1 ankyrin repeat domain-containing protein [Blastopirellula sediminis]